MQSRFSVPLVPHFCSHTKPLLTGCLNFAILGGGGVRKSGDIFAASLWLSWRKNIPGRRADFSLSAALVRDSAARSGGRAPPGMTASAGCTGTPAGAEPVL